MSSSMEMKPVVTRRSPPPCIPMNTQTLAKKAENEITATPPPTPKDPAKIPSHDRPFEVAENEITATPPPTPKDPAKIPSHDRPFEAPVVTPEPHATSHTNDITVAKNLTIFPNFCHAKSVLCFFYQVAVLTIFNVGCAFCSLASFDKFNVNMEVNEATFYALMGICLLASAILGACITIIVTLYIFHFTNVKFAKKSTSVSVYLMFMILGAFVVAASAGEIYNLYSVLYGKYVIKLEEYKWYLFGGCIITGCCAGNISVLSLDHDLTSKFIALVSLAAAPITLFLLHLGFTVVHPIEALATDGITIALSVLSYFLITSERGTMFCKNMITKICCCISPEPANNVVSA